VTWEEYETDLDEKLVDLHSRIHRGTYRAQPSKRAYIPKADGRQRPDPEALPHALLIL
jgi:RNA-directed DNA polymerase